MDTKFETDVGIFVLHPTKGTQSLVDILRNLILIHVYAHCQFYYVNLFYTQTKNVPYHGFKTRRKVVFVPLFARKNIQKKHFETTVSKTKKREFKALKV